ncbi:MAG: hypothetical protein V2I63_08205 [Pseudomonadales bacterium]|jgi:hypothetical protein|nr:hypothetical protein [Pseudomonadales bacterium]
MHKRALIEDLARGDPDSLERALVRILEERNSIHDLLPLLSCGEAPLEDAAARLVDALASADPSCLEPVSRRLTSIAGAVERSTPRCLLAAALPRLDLGRREAARLAHVFEGWIAEGDETLKRAAMDAYVELVPQCPRLADRFRRLIEQRLAAGTPVATRHGVALLQRLRSF